MGFAVNPAIGHREITSNGAIYEWQEPGVYTNVSTGSQGNINTIFTGGFVTNNSTVDMGIYSLVKVGNDGAGTTFSETLNATGYNRTLNDGDFELGMIIRADSFSFNIDEQNVSHRSAFVFNPEAFNVTLQGIANNDHEATINMSPTALGFEIEDGSTAATIDLEVDSFTVEVEDQGVIEIDGGVKLSHGDDAALLVSEDEMLVFDEDHEIGLQNDGDYEANFTARSLATKQYVDGMGEDVAYAASVTIDPTTHISFFTIGACTGPLTLNCDDLAPGRYIEVSLEPAGNAITLGGTNFILDPDSPDIITSTNVEVLILITRSRTDSNNVYSIKNIPTV